MESAEWNIYQMQRILEMIDSLKDLNQKYNTRVICLKTEARNLHELLSWDKEQGY